VNKEIKQLRDELKSSLKAMGDKLAQLTLSKENTKQHSEKDFASSPQRSDYAFIYEIIAESWGTKQKIVTLKRN
jgi:hypothetical protein